MNIVLNFDRYRVCDSHASMQNNVWDQKNAEERIRKPPLHDILKLQRTILIFLYAPQIKIIPHRIHLYPQRIGFGLKFKRHAPKMNHDQRHREPGSLKIGESLE